METIINHGNKNYLLDTKANQITFLDQRFYRTDKGDFVPSVTSLLDAYPKGAAYYEWLKKNGEDSDNIRDEAGRRGSRVHQMTESYDKGETVTLMDEQGNINMKLSEWAMFERYVEFRKRFPCEILENELTLVSETLGYGGTLDRVISLNGKKILVDIKTSNAIYPSYWLQLAAYEKMLNERGEFVDDVAILWLNAKTKTDGKKDAIQGKGYQLVLHGGDRAKDWNLFLATKQLWMAENGDSKPRELSYTLSHKL